MPPIKTKPPKPPGDYDPKKLVSFHFTMTGTLTCVQEWSVNDLRGLDFDAMERIEKEWMLELEEADCRVISQGKDLEDFPIDIDSDFALPDEPFYGSITTTAVEGVSLTITGPWKLRKSIVAGTDTLVIGDDELAIKEEFLRGKPAIEPEDTECFIAGELVESCPDLSCIPFSDIGLALELYLDFTYILDHSPITAYPSGRSALNADIVNGSGWGKLVELANALSPAYRAGLRCQASGIDRLFAESKALGLA